MKLDNDGYPTICMVCEQPIVKARHDSQHHYDHTTDHASSWHTTCSRNTHPFFCRGMPATVELVLGEWFCSCCGERISWVKS